MAVAETKKPLAVSRACKRDCARASLFHVLAFGTLVANGHSRLANDSGTALPTGTRALYGIPLKGQILKVFLRMNRWTMPYFCVAVYIRFPFLAFTSFSESTLTVFYRFLDLVGYEELVAME
nr:hypothetical protein L203_03910 [Cryptococcus depauperatus CBS 7841]